MAELEFAKLNKGVVERNLTKQRCRHSTSGERSARGAPGGLLAEWAAEGEEGFRKPQAEDAAGRRAEITVLASA